MVCIIRSSYDGHGGENPPVPGAFVIPYIKRGVNIASVGEKFPTPKVLSEEKREEWLSKGFNHRVEKHLYGDGTEYERYVRDEESYRWGVQIYSLEDLALIAEKIGYVVGFTGEKISGSWELMIMDDCY